MGMVFIMKKAQKMIHYTEFDTDKHELNTYKTKSKHKNWSLESDNILTLDIEASAGFYNSETDRIEQYVPFFSDEHWKKLVPVSLCYIWQFSFDGVVYYGRSLEEFEIVLAKLSMLDVHFIIYVHNLSYEFQFLCSYLEWKTVFARDHHKVMYCVPRDYENIEFRCSYFLTRLNLESWGDELGLPKMVGDLDYTILRTPLTKLTDTEMAYASRDCEVVAAGIRQYLKKYEHVKDIPYTQTGEIRRELRNRMNADPAMVRWMKDLIPDTAEFYKKLQKVFMGGYTHGNCAYENMTIREEAGLDNLLDDGVGYAFDFASLYPSLICSERHFPVTKFHECKFNKSDMDKYCYIMKVHFDSVEELTINHYIPHSKLIFSKREEKIGNRVRYIDIDDTELDNGRVIRGHNFDMWMTELDFMIICRTYDVKCHIVECYRSRRGYLPKPIVEYVLELYEQKTQYKGLPEKKDMYDSSKRQVNGVAGLMESALFFDEVDFEQSTGEWSIDVIETNEIDERIQKMKENLKGNVPLAFQFGIFITALGRFKLWTAMQGWDGPDCTNVKGECLDEYTIYCDTDSLKLLIHPDFEWLNKQTEEKLKACCDYYNIDYEKTCPKDKKGIRHHLGHFDEEDTWTEFRFLRSKNYCYRSTSDNQLHLTVSGVAKDSVVVLRDNIDNFNENTSFDKDYFSQLELDLADGKAEEYNKLWKGITTTHELYEKFKVKDGTKKLITYCHNQPHTWKTGEYDEYYSREKWGIAMRPTSYNVSILDAYLDMCNNYHCNLRALR